MLHQSLRQLFLLSLLQLLLQIITCSGLDQIEAEQYYSWYRNHSTVVFIGHGLQGLSGTPARFLKVPTIGFEDAKKVTCGWEICCYIDLEDKVKCAPWILDVALNENPIGLAYVQNLPNAVVDIDGYDETFCAVDSQGDVYCWGKYTRILHGGQTGSSSLQSARKITGVMNSTKVKVGRYAAASVSHDSSLVVWGSNEKGHLGTGNTINSNNPVTAISSGVRDVTISESICATLMNGNLTCWGNNNAGNLGFNNGASYLVPGGVTMTDVLQADCRVNTCMVVKTDGTLWRFGYLGTTYVGTGYGPEEALAPIQIPGITTATKVSVGDTHYFVILADRRILGLGRNSYNALFINNTRIIEEFTQTDLVLEEPVIYTDKYNRLHWPYYTPHDRNFIGVTLTKMVLRNDSDICEPGSSFLDPNPCTKEGRIGFCLDQCTSQSYSFSVCVVAPPEIDNYEYGLPYREPKPAFAQVKDLLEGMNKTDLDLNGFAIQAVNTPQSVPWPDSLEFYSTIYDRHFTPGYTIDVLFQMCDFGASTQCIIIGDPNSVGTFFLIERAGLSYYFKIPRGNSYVELLVPQDELDTLLSGNHLLRFTMSAIHFALRDDELVGLTGFRLQVILPSTDGMLIVREFNGDYIDTYSDTTCPTGLDWRITSILHYIEDYTHELSTHVYDTPVVAAVFAQVPVVYRTFVGPLLVEFDDEMLQKSTEALSLRISGPWCYTEAVVLFLSENQNVSLVDGQGFPLGFAKGDLVGYESMTAVLVQAPSKGTIVGNVYVPDENKNGPDMFTMRASASYLGVTKESECFMSYEVLIEPVDSKPVAQNISLQAYLQVSTELQLTADDIDLLGLIYESDCDVNATGYFTWSSPGPIGIKVCQVNVTHANNTSLQDTFYLSIDVLDNLQAGDAELLVDEDLGTLLIHLNYTDFLGGQQIDGFRVYIENADAFMETGTLEVERELSITMRDQYFNVEHWPQCYFRVQPAFSLCADPNTIQVPACTGAKCGDTSGAIENILYKHLSTSDLDLADSGGPATVQIKVLSGGIERGVNATLSVWVLQQKDMTTIEAPTRVETSLDYYDFKNVSLSETDRGTRILQLLVSAQVGFGTFLIHDARLVKRHPRHAFFTSSEDVLLGDQGISDFVAFGTARALNDLLQSLRYYPDRFETSSIIGFTVYDVQSLYKNPIVESDTVAATITFRRTGNTGTQTEGAEGIDLAFYIWGAAVAVVFGFFMLLMICCCAALDLLKFLCCFCCRRRARTKIGDSN